MLTGGMTPTGTFGTFERAAAVVAGIKRAGDRWPRLHRLDPRELPAGACAHRRSLIAEFGASPFNMEVVQGHPRLAARTTAARDTLTIERLARDQDVIVNLAAQSVTSMGDHSPTWRSAAPASYCNLTHADAAPLRCGYARTRHIYDGRGI
jgi:hypothetical protein